MMSYIQPKCHSRFFYFNLIQTCKYFFSKMPIIYAEYVRFEKERLILYNAPNTIISIDYDKANFKLWITKKLLYEFASFDDTDSKFMKNIYRFDGTYLHISNQDITMEDYMHLVSSKKLVSLTFLSVAVKNLDESLVSTDVLFKSLLFLVILDLLVFIFKNTKHILYF